MVNCVHASLIPAPSPKKGISVGSAVFAGITHVTNIQTDRQQTTEMRMNSSHLTMLAALVMRTENAYTCKIGGNVGCQLNKLNCSALPDRMKCGMNIVVPKTLRRSHNAGRIRER